MVLFTFTLDKNMWYSKLSDDVTVTEYPTFSYTDHILVKCTAIIHSGEKYVLFYNTLNVNTIKQDSHTFGHWLVFTAQASFYFTNIYLGE